MTHIFRLQGQTSGTDTLEDWADSQAYSSNAIDAISEPDGANTNKEITSIPSPFARIDLVKTAFKIVAASGNLDGSTIYHKMVSDTLDVAQIFFNYQKLRDKFEIIEWNVERDLSLLDGNQSNIGKTLRTYLQSDGNTYHFDKMRSIYILKYVGPDSNKVPNEGIIGATSPATLFFSTANKLAENGILSRNVHFGQDKPFDNEFCPLYKRDFEFVKYLYALRRSYREFASIFSEVNKYLDVTRRILTNEQNREIMEIDNDANFDIDSKYNRLQFGEAGVVDILQGLHFHIKPAIKPQSDFEILSDKCQGDKPFVLPVVNGAIYADFKYVTDEWGSENKAPFSDSVDIASRHLPFDGTQYPYLTISDFLEEKIIKLSYKINATDFFDGNLQSTSDSTYLLPIKPLYFKYFDVEMLRSEVARGKKSIEMRELAGGGVRVTLRIPVKGTDLQRYMEYSRDYDKIASTGNDGKVEFFDNVSFGLYPNVAFNADSEATLG